MTGRWQATMVSVLALIAGVSAQEALAGETLTIQGSTTVGPIAEAFAEALQKADSDISITVRKTGSGDGAAALIDGKCDVATLSRFMKDDEFKKAVEKGVLPVAHAIAMDGVCVVVHPSNTVKELTLARIRDIYTGKITNWKEVGGPDCEIVVIGRDSSSGTFEVFEEIAMKKEKVTTGAETVGSNPQMHARVKDTKGAIGYVGLGFVDKDVKALKVEGVMPTRKTIAGGTYPIARPLYLFTNRYPELGSLAHRFVTFHLTEKGQEIIEAKGFVPVTDY